MSRRGLLRAGGAAGLGLAGYALAGCGDDNGGKTGGNTPGATGTTSSGTGTTPAPKAGGVLKLSSQREPTTLFPVVNGNYGAENAINLPIYDRLFEYDPDLKLIAGGGLVAKFEHADPLSYTFTLQDGVAFHDGTPFNAEAVKKHLETVKTHPSSVGKGEVAAIDSMTAPDARTLVLKLARGQGDYPLTLAGRAGAIVSPTAVDKYGNDIGRNPSGTGPFRLKEWAPGTRWSLEKNPNYWRKGLPYLDRIDYTVVSEDQVIAQGLRGGDVDAASGQAALVAQYDLLKGADNLKVLERPGFQFTMFYMNGSKPPFSNVALAQAVAFAIDREDVVKAAFFGRGWPSQGFIPQGHPYFDDKFNPYGTKANVEKAKQKLAEGGMPNGFEFIIDTYDTGYYVRLAPALQQMLAKVGIKTTIRPQDSPTGTQRIFSLDMDAVASQWSGRANLLESVTGMYHSTGGYNAGAKRVKNDQFDRLVEKAGNAIDANEARAAYQELQKVVAEDARNVAFGAVNVLGYHQKNLQGYVLNADAGTRLISVSRG
jgi:ABC-type transport system substrate-binding protein